MLRTALSTVARRALSALAVRVAPRLERLTRPAKTGLLLAFDSLLICAALGSARILVPQGPASPWGLALLLTAGAAGSLALGVARTRLRDHGPAAILRTALLAVLLSGFSQSGLAGALTGAAAVALGLGFFAGAVVGRIALVGLLVGLYRAAQQARPVIIYGAGTTGLRIAAALGLDGALRPVAFVDDNPALHGLRMAGLRVHPVRHLRELAARTGARSVIVAVPSLDAARRARVTRRIAALGLEPSALPAFAQLIAPQTGNAPGEASHFLTRAPLACDVDRLGQGHAGRTVLVTGAGGSIGSELCRQILALEPKRLVLLELSEHALFQVERELAADPAAAGVEIVPVLGSATDARLVRDVIRDNAIEVVLHAAAYKHVPLVEANPVAGLVNNVLGTHVLAREAQAAGVARFILISSDKAVRPTSIMGASKRLAELVIQDLARRSSSTRFAAVRFGNVLGSSGSVVPIFRDQIAAGGPVTLTDPEATRYFMTIEEAVRLVLIAGAEAAGGEIFVLDMGDPVRIADLARNMIESAGLTVRGPDNPQGDIDIQVIGLRPGERLHEIRMTEGARPSGVHPAILSVEVPVLSEIETASALHAIRNLSTSGDRTEAARIIARFCDEGARKPQPLRLLTT